MKNNKAITLIALVITIVVLIILAGVAINLTLGENGVFRKATTAQQQYQIAAAKEIIDLKIAELQTEKNGNATLEELVEYLKEDTNINYTISLTEVTASVSSDIIVGDANEIYVVYKIYQFRIDKKLETTFVSIVGSVDNIQTGDLPENTPTTSVGTEVKLPDSWATETMRYVSTTDGKDVTSTTKVSTVYAVSVGDGNIVPVPYEFYYVGGNLSTGVVISDKEEDSFLKNKRDMSSHEDSKNLIGNQFVWIPCTENEYVKTNWGQGSVTNRSNAYWDTTVDRAGLLQVQKYGGFYISRYEAGLANTITPTTTDTVYTENIYNVEGTPISKAGQIPWNFIDWTNSRINAQNMYNTNTVGTGLITGTQWDVMINKINLTESKSITSPSTWGNFYDVEMTYTGRFATYTVSTHKLAAFSENEIVNATKSANAYVLLTTGSSEKVKTYNIYDVSGNLWEWTEETSYYGSSKEYRNVRAGGYSATSEYPACYRSGTNSVSDTRYNIGFRIALYIK